jgi:FlaA1/EpsC-like NDP-sugar epimerase
MILRRFALPMLGLPRIAKRVVVLALDTSLCVLTVWLAYYLRLGELLPLEGQALWAVGTSIAVALPIFIVVGLYRAIFRFSGWPTLMTVTKAVGLYAVIFAAVITAVGVPGVPRTIGLIQPILLLLFVGASRVLAQVWLGDQYQSILKQAARPKVLIYGAGKTGRQLAAAMASSPEMQVVGFLDDDERLQGQALNGQSIYNPGDLVHLASALGISAVLLAMPSMARKRRNEVIAQMRNARVSVRTLPSVTDLAQGRVNLSDLRELDIDDLLCREPVKPNALLLNRNTHNKVVLVTGAGGSIGSELCRQILKTQPRQLLIVEMSEFALYQIFQDLQAIPLDPTVEIVPLLASAFDEVRMYEIMNTWKPQTVYHAAAYKHVPLVEHNPAEGVRNNVWGTWVCAEAAARNGVQSFVLISTDKAVRPTNIMGATKRLAEMVLQALAQSKSDSKTAFSMVRFGNVLGSSGSVVPLFREQIKNGGPITLTHADITRYFMTIPEAAQLVIQAGAMGTGGDVFVLDMGQPVRIYDLARRMVELSGLNLKEDEQTNGDIEIAVTGLRPGEKLYEELMIGDNPQSTQHARIMKAHETFTPWDKLQEQLKALKLAMSVNDVPVIRALLQQMVPGYQPSGEVVDWVHLALERETAAGEQP